MHFRSAENIFFQHRIGTLDDDEFSGYLNFYRRLFSQPHVIERWEGQKEIFSREFQEESDPTPKELSEDIELFDGWGVNVRCLDGVDLSDIPVKEIFGSRV